MTENIIDPRDLILESPMSRPQKMAVALTTALSALDGFDILSIAFVAPVLAREFHLDSGALGLLLSSGLIGTLIGSLALAALADIIGRRPVALISLAIMTTGMLLSAFCQSIAQLAGMRVLTGIGIGAMVVVLNPIAVEFSNRRSRSFAISMMSIGYPLGGMIGGAVAAFLLPIYSWPAVFLFGAGAGVVLAPLVIWRLPESLSFLIERRSESSLPRVNALLERFGHPKLTGLPAATINPKLPYREIFQGAQLAITLRVAAISLLTFVTIYFFLSWQPKILVDVGFAPAKAASLAGASSFAGACACLLFGLLSRVVSGRILALVSILALGVFVSAFGNVPPSPTILITVALLAGSCVAAATIGLYVTAADAFEPRMRATGMGFIIGIGRVGSALAPALAGGLFAAGTGRGGVTVTLGAFAVVAALLLIGLPRHSRAA